MTSARPLLCRMLWFAIARCAAASASGSPRGLRHRSLQSTQRINASVNGEACMTIGVSGVGPGVECVFPFKYDNSTYNSCTRYDAASPWCSTKTDEEGNHVSGQWGYCSSSCSIDADVVASSAEASTSAVPGAAGVASVAQACTTTGSDGVGPGVECVFPFKYGGTTYSACSRSEVATPWCSTKRDAEGNHVSGQWGYCSSSCPTSADVVALSSEASTSAVPGAAGVSSVAQACTTTGSDGVGPGVECVFPFKYGGTTYSVCSSSEVATPWCSTKRDAEGNHVSGQWGYCSSSCPTSADVVAPGSEASTSAVARVLTTLPPASGCVNVADWTDSENASCEEYASEGWCTSTGAAGPQWDMSWGDLQEYSSNGYSARGACCACGGGLTETFDAMFKVLNGDCIEIDNCVASPNYPANYSENQFCTIVINNTEHKEMEVVSWETEDYYDYLAINGRYYSGKRPPRNVVPMGSIGWFADEGTTAKGWKLCPGSPRPVGDPNSMFQVMSGSCVVDSNSCVSSPNYPAAYGSNHECEIKVNNPEGKSIDAQAFSTEQIYDVLWVNDEAFSGTNSPQGYVPQGIIEWESDEDTEGTGWKLCPGPIGSHIPEKKNEGKSEKAHSYGGYGSYNGSYAYAYSYGGYDVAGNGRLCKTAGAAGVGPGVKCVFPFTYGSATYNSCTEADAASPWCSTRTDGEGNHIPNQWGYCSSSCPADADGIAPSSKPSTSMMATAFFEKKAAEQPAPQPAVKPEEKPSPWSRPAREDNVLAAASGTEDGDGGDDGNFFNFLLKTALAAVALCMLGVLCLKVRRWSKGGDSSSGAGNTSYGRSYALDNL